MSPNTNAVGLGSMPLGNNITINDEDEDAPGSYGPTFADHYSLRSPSSTVKFRSSNMHIHNQTTSQFLLEERFVGGESNNEIHSIVTVKRSDNSSHGESVVRALYSAIAVFMGAVFFIFAIGLVLFLLSDLVEQLNDWDVTKVFPIFGTIFAVPILVDGLTYLLVLTTGFVVDVFSGNPLLNSFGCGSVITNWASFLAFGGVPMFVLIGSLMARSQRVVEITLISSFASVGLFFLVFTKTVCMLLVKSSLDLIQELEGRDNMSLFQKVKSAVWFSAQSRLSGKQRELHIYSSNDFALRQFSTSKPSHSHVYMTRGKLWLRMTQLPIMSCLFETLEHPQRRWTQCEISGALPFITRYSWGLESVFCRSRDRDGVVVVGGPSAMTNRQALSSAICYFLGITIYILLLAGITIWLQLPSVVAIVIIAISLVFAFGKLR